MPARVVNANCVAGMAGCNCANMGRRVFSDYGAEIRRLTDQAEIDRLLSRTSWRIAENAGGLIDWLPATSIWQVQESVTRDNWGGWSKMWKQVGVAHTAAVYMKEVHYQNGEITNESSILGTGSN